MGPSERCTATHLHTWHVTEKVRCSNSHVCCAHQAHTGNAQEGCSLQEQMIAVLLCSQLVLCWALLAWRHLHGSTCMMCLALRVAWWHGTMGLMPEAWPYAWYVGSSHSVLACFPTEALHQTVDIIANVSECVCFTCFRSSWLAQMLCWCHNALTLMECPRYDDELRLLCVMYKWCCISQAGAELGGIL